MTARLKENVMPIYLVRWPDLSASLVQADGEDHLLDILDQVGNPDDCEWNIYDGPLFIDFRLPVEWSIPDDRRGTPLAPTQVVLSDVGRIASGNVVEALQACLADADDGYETGAEIPKVINTGHGIGSHDRPSRSRIGKYCHGIRFCGPQPSILIKRRSVLAADAVKSTFLPKCTNGSRR